MTTIALTRTGIEPAAQNHDAEYDAKFTTAYETYYTKVFAFIYSRVRDVELAKDLVASTFERAYVKGHEVREEAAYGAWLFMIAKNVIAGHFRRTSREANHIDRACTELRFVDGPPSPEDVLLRDERVGRLIAHIGTLPRRDQELLSLKFDAELTNTEIADVLHMTPLNVRVAIFRALKRLRVRMEADIDAAAA